MYKRKIKGSFLLGGITGKHVELLEKGLFNKIFDTQTFDREGVKSLKENKDHIEIDGSFYASPFNKGSLINNLDFVVLSALEIDTDFNVNVLTGSNGDFRGASGGHSDTAYGSKVSIVVAPSFRGRIPTIKDRVTTVITPGETVDIVVTERGVAVNPENKELLKDLQGVSGIDLVTIEELKNRAISFTGNPKPLEFSDQIVGLIEYRNGKIIDGVRKVKD
jgi:citrate lyase subunit alpha/citrate CoA-transferase